MNRDLDTDRDARRGGLSVGRVFLLGLGLTGAVVGLGTGLGSYYTVSPTEMAGVRRFGTVITTEPVGPGLHFKAPWIDTADKLQVSLQTVEQQMKVHTVDNQPVDLGVRVVYRIPRSAVLPLLYTVGRAGDADIGTQIEGLVADRTSKIFAQKNTNSISTERQEISNEINTLVTQDLKKLYGLDVQDYQISSIGYSPSFNNNIEDMVRSKTQVLTAQNKEQEIRAQGEQAKITADATAYQTRVTADATAYQTEKQADAQAYGTRTEGTAEADSIKARRGTFGSDQGFNDYLRATRYSGNVPTTVVVGGGAGSAGLSTILGLPGLGQVPNAVPGR